MKTHSKNKESKEEFMNKLGIDFKRKKDGTVITADEVHVFKPGEHGAMKTKVIKRGESQ